MSFLKRLKTLGEATAKQSFQEFNVKALKAACLGHIDGVAICDLSLYQKNPAHFLQLTTEAMALIKTIDPRRYRRVCRYLDYIVNMELISAGSFERKLKICHVDFQLFSVVSRQEWNVRVYACLWIHEATHGVLEEKWVLYDADKRQRIEGLCHLEEYRFAKRFEPGWADTYIGPFQPERWKLHWEGTPKDRLAAFGKRLTNKQPPID